MWRLWLLCIRSRKGKRSRPRGCISIKCTFSLFNAWNNCNNWRFDLSLSPPATPRSTMKAHAENRLSACNRLNSTNYIVYIRLDYKTFSLNCSSVEYWVAVLIFRPHRGRPTMYVDAAYCYGPSSVVCLSVGPSVTVVSPAKTAQPIEMPFGLRTRVGPRNHY